MTLAAVDLGILNLTRYETPDPEAYYFGQRRLGMSIRDLYNQLIDRMQGVRGVVRTGGDAGLARFAGATADRDAGRVPFRHREGRAGRHGARSPCRCPTSTAPSA